ncbi:hydrolase_2 domain-containing protein [Aeromonas phage PVN03]|uniref:Hydrolase_2 domain-containing protein n=1 Tax=Aeromonas phage PVN03 TaxID=2822864 RepID=A0AAE7USA4_9CAUD|nr:hydrolase_2 domain-containing protein [Aeromonas phage PVN03]QTQ06795.1 hydrolase_2 domain-containing protein [Aeromonas phage PVN03]
MQNIIKILVILLTLSSFSCKASVNFGPINDNTLAYVQAGYYEARDGGRLAMKLVMSATYNRVVDGRWPRSAKRVVWQSGQYAWTGGQRHRASLYPKATAPADRAALAEAVSLARSLRAGDWEPSISANHFLSPGALSGPFPRWARCTAALAAKGRCVSYKGQKVRSPDFTYNGTWFYTL